MKFLAIGFVLAVLAFVGKSAPSGSSNKRQLASFDSTLQELQQGFQQLLPDLSSNKRDGSSSGSQDPLSQISAAIRQFYAQTGMGKRQLGSFDSTLQELQQGIQQMLPDLSSNKRGGSSSGSQDPLSQISAAIRQFYDQTGMGKRQLGSFDSTLQELQQGIQQMLPDLSSNKRQMGNNQTAQLTSQASDMLSSLQSQLVDQLQTLESISSK